MKPDKQTSSFCLSVANLRFSFTSDSLISRPSVYTAFEGSEGPAPAAGTYHITEALSDTPTDATLLWSGPTWRMSASCTHYHIDLRILDTDDWVPTAVFTHDFSRGDLVPLVGRDPAPSDVCLNYPLDQILFINRLPRCGAVLLHASGVLFNDRVYLFCGRSDIGKTTLARLWRNAGATLLNDDRMLVWMDGDTVLASPSPWHGEDPEINVHTAPVAGVYHLHQHPEHTLRPLSSIQALGALTATAVLPFYLKESLEPGLEVLQAVAESSAAWRLGFTPDKSVVEFVLKANSATW